MPTKMEKDAEELRRIVHKNNELLIEIRTCLFGVTGSKNGGLVGDYQTTRKDFYSFRRICLLVIGIAMGTGFLSVGLYQAIQAGIL